MAAGGSSTRLPQLATQCEIGIPHPPPLREGARASRFAGPSRTRWSPFPQGKAWGWQSSDRYRKNAQVGHCEPVTDVTGVAIRNIRRRGNGFPRQCAHWLGMTKLAVEGRIARRARRMRAQGKRRFHRNPNTKSHSRIEHHNEEAKKMFHVKPCIPPRGIL